MIKIELDEKNGAWTFAEFLKRITYNGVAECAIDKEQTEYMISIIENVRGQMANQGIAPR